MNGRLELLVEGAAPIVAVLLMLGVLGVALVLSVWRRRGRGRQVRDGSEVCWVHYDRFGMGGQCRVCGLNGGYTGLKRVVVVLDHGRGSAEWKLVRTIDVAGGMTEGLYESQGPPEAWEDAGTLRVDWLRYGKPLSFDGVEIVRATDEEVESFVQQARQV